MMTRLKPTLHVNIIFLLCMHECCTFPFCYIFTAFDNHTAFRELLHVLVCDELKKIYAVFVLYCILFMLVGTVACVQNSSAPVKRHELWPHRPLKQSVE